MLRTNNAPVVYLFVLYRLAGKRTKIFNACRTIVRLIKPFIDAISIFVIPVRALNCISWSARCNGKFQQLFTWYRCRHRGANIETKTNQPISNCISKTKTKTKEISLTFDNQLKTTLISSMQT